MSSIHELLKQVYPLKLRMELFNAIWTGWKTDIKEKDQQIAELKQQLAEKDAELEKWSTQYAKAYVNRQNALIAEKVELQHQLEEKDKEIADLQYQLKVIKQAFKLACDELRSLNYRTFNNADIDFEEQFKEQAEKEIKGEK